MRVIAAVGNNIAKAPIPVGNIPASGVVQFFGQYFTRHLFKEIAKF